jgi:hypothetical protein
MQKELWKLHHSLSLSRSTEYIVISLMCHWWLWRIPKVTAIFISVRHGNSNLEIHVLSFLSMFFRRNYWFLASIRSFVLRVSVFDCQFICLPLSVRILLHSSWPCPLHRFTCPITTGLYSDRPLPKLALFNAEGQDPSDGNTRGNTKIYPGISTILVTVHHFKFQ